MHKLFIFSLFLVGCYSAPLAPPPNEHPTPPPPNAQGTLCGGLAGKICAQDEYCQFPQGAQCGAADQTGICRTRPQVCTQEYGPVCGCDGRTYSNACMAAARGTSVLHAGECKR